ncbi:MAG TPA: LysR family transcriptional regulator [Kineosporiaceae bacterium]|nr:LysR family transcriptional regulator [Kineosporiaceae bacterium]
MTPTQLKAFSAVVRLGSVKEAAAELNVTEAAVSLHIGTLRKELGDKLFTRTSAGLAFTPGGLRLARRAIEMLGLQDRTIREVSQAGRGRRLLRIASSSLFAEHAAPGLIQLFTRRADDLDVEMIVCQADQFQSLLDSRAVDIAIGPNPVNLGTALVATPFLNFQLVIVAAPDHPGLATMAEPSWLTEQTWLLGPAAVGDDSVMARALAHFAVPDGQQKIFQSNAAALEEAKRGKGVALAVAYTVAGELTGGRLVRVPDHGLAADAVWNTITLAGNGVLPAASELIRFVAMPRAIQAMLRGSGVNVGHFRPYVHVTLWS